MIDETTYYGGDEREAIKDMYSPYAQKKQFTGSCINKVLSGKHVLVIGATGKGKSYWMCEVCKLLPSFIFINSQEETIVDGVTQVVTDNEDEVIELLEDGHRKIQFLPSEDDMVAIDQLKTIRLDLWSIASEMNIKDGEFWMNVIVDEAQIYAWKGSRQDVENIARRGRRYGIKGFFLTQRPQNLAAGIVNNVTHQVIFQTGAYETPYFKNYKIPIEEEKDWLEKPFHYIVYDGFSVQRCIPA